MNLKQLAAGACAAAFVMGAAGAAGAVDYIYVGAWAVADGPLWSGGSAESLSGRQAAALIFGGNASDYAISTRGSDVNTINFMAFLDGYGDTQYLTNAQDQDFVGVFGDSYDDGFGNYSAYVFDHACGIHYCDNGGGENAINYAFRIDNGAVPEPGAWALMILGFGAAGSALRSRRKAAATA
jgi:hypothetical protein